MENFKNKVILFMKRYKIILLIIVAFLINVFFIKINNNFFPNKITNDGTIYHNYAVNIINGNGYSFSNNYPYIESYYREPGYPYFIATVYKLYEIISFQKVKALTDKEFSTANLETPHPEIQFLYYFQALIGAFNILLLYVLLSLKINNKIAFIISLLCVFYFPVGFLTGKMLRETLQLFITLLFSISFAKLLINQRIKHLIFSGIFLGLGFAILQIYLILPIFIFIYSWVFYKEFWSSLKNSLVISLFALIVVTPWFIKVYGYYPDIRTFLSCGSYLTLNRINYKSTAIMAHELGCLDKSEYLYALDNYLYANSYIKFQRSFNGYYKSKTDSINNLIPLKKKICYKTNMYLSNTYNSFYNFYFDKKKSIFIQTNKFIIPLFNIIYTLLLLFALYGLYKSYRRIFPIILLYFVFILLAPVIGGLAQGRRTIYFQLFNLGFSVLGIVFFMNKYFKNLRIKIFK